MELRELNKPGVAGLYREGLACLELRWLDCTGLRGSREPASLGGPDARQETAGKGQDWEGKGRRGGTNQEKATLLDDRQVVMAWKEVQGGKTNEPGDLNRCEAPRGGEIKSWCVSGHTNQVHVGAVSCLGLSVGSGICGHCSSSVLNGKFQK